MTIIIGGILLISSIVTIAGVFGGISTAMLIGAGTIVVGGMLGVMLVPMKTFWKILWVISMVFLFSGMIAMFFTGSGFLLLIIAAIIGAIAWLIRIFSGPGPKNPTRMVFDDD